jgi:hypothetical protein
MRQREWLPKSYCASWSLETACGQSMWLKKPNPGLTIYLLRLPRSKLRILVGLITGHCPLNKHLHTMGLTDKSIRITCGMEDESAFHLLCGCHSLISLRMRTCSKPILGVCKHPSIWLQSFFLLFFYLISDIRSFSLLLKN